MTKQPIRFRTFPGLMAPVITMIAMIAIMTISTTRHTAANEAPQNKTTHIVALGDSLTAGYMLPPGAGFPEQLTKALVAKGYSVKVTNAGVSGDTSSGGLARLDWAMNPETDLLILELGSNDALRGIDPAVTRSNLGEIITRAKAQGVHVLIAGMLAPPNMGEDYAADFNPIFEDLAREHKTALYPFFLDGVAANPDLNLADGMHPTEEGVAIIVERILPTVETLINETQTASQGSPAIN